MSKNKIAFSCGLILILVQLTGFPYYVNTTLYILIGLILMILGTMGHIRRRSRELIQSHPDHSFLETRGPVVDNPEKVETV